MKPELFCEFKEFGNLQPFCSSSSLIVAHQRLTFHFCHLYPYSLIFLLLYNSLLQKTQTQQNKENKYPPSVLQILCLLFIFGSLCHIWALGICPIFAIPGQLFLGSSALFLFLRKKKKLLKLFSFQLHLAFQRKTFQVPFSIRATSVVSLPFSSSDSHWIYQESLR